MKKINFKKYTPYILGGLFGGAIGFSFAFFDDKNNIISNINIFELCLFFLLAYYVAVVVHELTHFIVFKINKINMRALLIGPLIFIKKDSKWTFKFKFTKIFSAGGIAIPDIDIISNEKDFVTFRNGFSKALIAAPIASIIFNIVFALLTFIFKSLFNSPIINHYMNIFLIMLSLATLLITISSMMKNEIAIGDYQAYFAAKKDRNFVLLNLYQYIMFSTKYNTMESKSFLIENLDKYFEEASKSKLIDLYLLSSVDNILYDYLTDKIDSIPQGAKNYIDFTMDNLDLIYDKLKQKEVPSIFLHHIVFYLAFIKDNKVDAIEFYSKISRKIKVDTPILKYYDLRANHLLGLQNNFSYISDKTNIKTSSLYELLSLFDNYYEDEYSLYDKIYNL